MRILDYIEYSVSPGMKVLICGVVIVAILVIHWWEPSRKRKRREPNRDGLFQYTEVDPSGYARQTPPAAGNAGRNRLPQRHETLRQLDEYADLLKQHRINDFDDV